MKGTPTIIPAELLPAVQSKPSALQALGRQLLLKQLGRLEHGRIHLVEPGGEWHFGAATARCPFAVTLRVSDPQFFADTAFGGTVGAGESYIKGAWRCDDLTTLVRMMVVNRAVVSGLDGRWAALSSPMMRFCHWLNRNTRAGSARNIAAHYDLGNELFELMLDETMAYSCAIFPHPGATLAQASITKFDTVCRKLALGPADHLLEIGTGWGGLAIHAAQYYGCKVTTTTISRAQHDYARERIARAGLTGRITLLLDDYRDLTGQYDKLASIEMIEAVGERFLETYLATCMARLRPGGAMLLQSITIRDQLFQQALASVDFIQRYIFPGSFIPSVQALIAAFGRATDLKLTHLEDIGPHYATTLRLWRERFHASLERVRALGYPESFVRMWEFYLCYCEGGFVEGQLGDVQMLLTRPG